MLDIITFGSAAIDIYLKSKKLNLVDSNKFPTGTGVCFSLGSKIEIDDIIFLGGGGGTNTAETFSRQGLKTGYCGMVGKDMAGEEVIKDLADSGVESFIVRTDKRKTNQSVILSQNGNERSVLVYRGASGELSRKDIPFNKLKAKFFYFAPLSGKLCHDFEFLVNFAHESGAKVVVNPSSYQLALPKDKFKRIIKKVDILILNQEEASLLTGIPFEKEEELFKKIDCYCPGIAIMTKGSEGVVVSDEKNIYRAKSLKTKEVNATGAGDAFSSGFVSGFIETNGDIEYAIRLGIANSVSCIKKMGARNGLLKRGDKWEKVKVEKIAIKN
ncbi:MAG: hypothetical protein COS96_02020 [Candidatus Nealsonbacteria bacterium CG07_land_8_20_14_0_80_39_13]|nr:MAG: hypothetical protein COS96_02020 [Candidatus Nealsonbacteria bacterium CG07_land_8_20_14_0_80_39_13]